MPCYVWSALRERRLIARGLVAGVLRDLVIDLRTWSVRALVVEAGAWFGYRDALMCPVELRARVVEDHVAGRRARHGRLRAESAPPGDERRWCSARTLVGSRLHGPDGAMGTLTDLVVDDDGWMVREMVADARERLPTPVLLPPQCVRQVDIPGRQVRLALSGSELELLHRRYLRAQASAVRASVP